MTLMDTVKGMMGGSSSTSGIADAVANECGAHSGLVSHAMDLVNSPETGGIQGLVQKFHANGLGDVANSWVGQGANQPVSAEAIEKVLGQDRINAIASKFGMSAEDVSAKLAQVLPCLIDRLTSGKAAAA